MEPPSASPLRRRPSACSSSSCSALSWASRAVVLDQGSPPPPGLLGFWPLPVSAVWFRGGEGDLRGGCAFCASWWSASDHGGDPWPSRSDIGVLSSSCIIMMTVIIVIVIMS